MGVMPMLQPSLEPSTAIKMLVEICTETSAFLSNTGFRNIHKCKHLQKGWFKHAVNAEYFLGMAVTDKQYSKPYLELGPMPHSPTRMDNSDSININKQDGCQLITGVLNPVIKLLRGSINLSFSQSKKITTMLCGKLL